MDELEQLKAGKRSDLTTKREQALDRIDVHTIPVDMGLGKILREVFTGGWQEMMDDVIPFLAENRQDYQDLMDIFNNTSPTDKGILKPEDYLAAANMNIGAFLGDVTQATFNRGATVAAMMAAAAQPRVIKASIEAATRKGGSVTDRQMLLQMTKMLPQPKGAEVNIHFGNDKPSDGKTIEAGDNAGHSVIKFETFVKDTARDLREGKGRKLLNEAIVPMEVDFSAEDDENEV